MPHKWSIEYLRSFIKTGYGREKSDLWVVECEWIREFRIALTGLVARHFNLGRANKPVRSAITITPIGNTECGS